MYNRIINIFSSEGKVARGGAQQFQLTEFHFAELMETSMTNSFSAKISYCLDVQ